MCWLLIVSRYVLIVVDFTDSKWWKEDGFEFIYPMKNTWFCRLWLDWDNWRFKAAHYCCSLADDVLIHNNMLQWFLHRYYFPLEIAPSKLYTFHKYSKLLYISRMNFASVWLVFRSCKFRMLCKFWVIDHVWKF